jgi:hypothetical protein
MLIVSKAISLANSPALTELEIGERTRDWAEALSPDVPENWLQQSFRRAVHDHRGSFPLTCYEVLDAYKVLRAEIPDEAPKGSLLASDEAARECRRCLGSGFVHKFDVDGSILGTTTKICDHVPLEGELLFVAPKRELREVRS